jgi:transcriptional adapter 2-alpha
MPASTGSRQSVTPLDISETDGADLLSESEKHLCSNLRLFPRAYLSIKDTILKEYAAKGVLKRRAVRSLIKIDVNKTSRIFDFFLEMGWIANK